MIDYLIMLLSTDWFSPHWPVLGINVNEDARAAVMKGCRETVHAMMNGKDQYYLIDFSLARQERTTNAFSKLLEESNLGDSCKEVVAEWTNMTQAELTAAWIFTRLTQDLFSGDVGDGRPTLEYAIRDQALAVMEESEPEHIDFVAACFESPTSWDESTRSLEPGLPELLPATLISVLREQRFNEFWYRLSQRLSSTQRNALVSWYGAMARFRKERYDLIPRCVMTI